MQVSTQLIPPYSGYLPDYADPSSEKLKIILQFNDFLTPQYNIKLKLEIKGNGFTIVTKQLFNPPPIVLQPGIPTIISGVDLAPYLNSSNLDFIGINQAQYENRMALPEGFYSICVTAYDYYNPGKIQVSNQSCSNAWFTLSNPPFLNLPLCSKNITPQVPQNIVFQWTPVNIGSPNSATSTEYDFELWEVRPDSSVNPNQIVLSTAPVYSTTTNLTLVNYGIAEPPLNLYMKYVWRVRARDLSGRDWFKNNGYSQICTFVYGNLSSVLGNALNLTLNANGITHRMGHCTWNAQSIYTNYKLQVRKQGTQNWFDYNTSGNFEKVNNLEPNTDYEARVRGEGSALTGDWSNVASFRTLSEPVYGCGDQTFTPDAFQAQALPISKAVPGLIIQSGQFEVKASQITPNGPQGWYSGKGTAEVYGFPIAVKFNNIYIDDNNRHQQGIIEALTEGITAWTQQWDIEFAENNASYIPGKIDSIWVSGNQICVKIQGDDSCFTMPPNQNIVVVRDGEGNQYNVQTTPPPPKITGPFNYITYGNDNIDAKDSCIVHFEQSNNQQFGFDKKQYAAWINNYETIKLNNGKTYFVPYKSVGENATDKVKAGIKIIPFDANKLSFKTRGGQTCVHTSAGANSFEVTVPTDAGCVYAYYDSRKIGKLNVVTLKQQNRKLVLVPVNNAALSVSNVQNELNKLFGQANVNWSVTTKSNFNFNLGNDGLEAADANLLSKYSTEMRALRDAYKSYDSLYDKEAYYIFVVNNFNDPAVKGYMVRGRGLGFVAANASVKHLAHELAHGAFGLEHSFPAIAKNTSNNLMDYKEQGVELSAMQWEEMHSSQMVFNWFDTEEDAAVISSLLSNESQFMNFDFKNENPFFDEAAELFKDILTKSSAYAIQLDRSNQFVTIVRAKMFFFGNEISIENAFNYYTNFTKDIDFLMDWGLDFYDLQTSLNPDIKKRIYFYLARSEDRWKHSKQPPLAIDLLARIATGIPTAVYGYASGKDLIDGHTLSGAEHALNLLEIVPVTLIGTKVLKGIRSIKVGEKALDLAASSFSKTKEEIKKLAQKALNEAGGIAQTLSSTLRAVHDRLILSGIKHVVNGNTIKYLTKNNEELAKIENNIFTVTKPKGNIPTPDKYLDANYITNHINKFNQEGGAFIIRKSDIINPNYNKLVDRKFIGLKSEMETVINKYKNAGKDKQILIDELDLGNNYFSSANDDVFLVTVEPNKGFVFDIPTGNEIGAYVGQWVPGGYTKHGTAEAVISNSSNFVHNNNFETFKSIFGINNVVKIN